MKSKKTGKTTPVGRAKKQVRKTVLKAKKSVNKKVADGLRKTAKKVSRIIDRTAKAVRKKSRKSSQKAGLKGTHAVSPKAKKAASEVMCLARGIRKENPQKKWTSCVKEAGALYRKKHKK